MEILGHFKRTSTRREVSEATGYNRNLVNSTVTRLIDMGLIEEVERAAVEKSTVWLRQSDAGRKLSKEAVSTKPRTHTTYSKAVPSVIERCEERSLMNRPPYTPPKDTPARPGALDFKLIGSKGIR
jgi:DNA-binding MarR family transcriptional regulator